ncbi:MAG: hypothetical protein KC506_03770, partial [Nanoarchaeota archaeon]|nr:hypothetical protein [Nanoarchaeota archaeon]
YEAALNFLAEIIPRTLIERSETYKDVEKTLADQESKIELLKRTYQTTIDKHRSIKRKSSGLESQLEKERDKREVEVYMRLQSEAKRQDLEFRERMLKLDSEFYEIYKKLKDERDNAVKQHEYGLGIQQHNKNTIRNLQNKNIVPILEFLVQSSDIGERSIIYLDEHKTPLFATPIYYETFGVTKEELGSAQLPNLACPINAKKKKNQIQVIEEFEIDGKNHKVISYPVYLGTKDPIGFFLEFNPKSPTVAERFKGMFSSPKDIVNALSKSPKLETE